MNLLTNARDTLNEKYEGQDEDKIVRISARVIADCGSEQVQRSEPTGSHIRNPKSEIRNRYVRLTVEDHGNGIPPEVLERMFEPFFTTKPKDKGTGLGLSIIHGIVKDHGGKLSVESKPGRWTRVHVDLPNAECGLRIAEPEEAEIGSGGLPCG
ncbi:MAG: hypothetical protein HN700_12960, partial [Verrucomicrobia bacterium]|nr:hypothetical protein [Verrucomicrobiota bacterium]